MSANAETRRDLAPTLPGHAGTPIVDPGPNAAVPPSRDGLHNGLARRGEGERSVLSLRSEEEEEKGTLPPPQSTEGTTLASTLTELGVFLMAPAKQRATAAQLAGAGVTADHLRLISDFVAESEPDAGQRRRYLAAVLVDVARTKEALANIETHRASATPRDEYHAINTPIGSTSCSCSACRLYRASVSVEPWDHDRQSMVAACLAGGDRWPLERVAEFFGVSLTTAAVMVERGRVLKTSAYVESLGAAPLKKKEPVDDAEERAKQFRNGSRAHRLQLLREAIPTRDEAQG